MSIKSKLQEVKDNLRKDYNNYRGNISNSDDGVAMNLYKVEELISTGFIKKKVDYLLDYGLQQDDIDTYFKEECANDKFMLDIESETVGELINQLKLQTVKEHLNQELSNYLKEIKS